ncbi:MAG: hypothetical protein PHU43_04095 [Candidatus Bipolaricaulis sp.]|nr:hypothetical protein [Candidatus Bipolaricaulis sp.]
MRACLRTLAGFAAVVVFLLFASEDGNRSPGDAFAVNAPAQESLLYEEDFDAGRADSWELPNGWKVESATDRGGVLHGRGHSYARYVGDAWGDYSLILQLKIIKGRMHLNFRVSNCTRYFVGFEQGGLDLSKTSPCGTHKKLKSVSQNRSRNRWCEVKISGSGGRIEVYVDGAMALAYSDPDPLLYGSIGLETLEDSEFLVDDLRVTGPQTTQAAGLQWTRTGGPLGGIGYDVRMRPDNPDWLYVTDAWSGVSVSSDGGATWHASNHGIVTRIGPSGDAIPIFCLSLDPHNPDTIWVGTDGLRGIFKSLDGGATWVEADRGVVEDNGITFRGFTVDPYNSDVVYAAAEIFSWVWAGEERRGRGFDMTQGVVYRTTDGGRHWQALWRGDNLARYVWIDPRDPNVLYVSTGIFDREAANSSPKSGAAGGVGILKSTDGGETWRALGKASGLRNLYIGSLFMHPETPDTLLAGAGNLTYGAASGVYLSEDGGETWTWVLVTDSEEPVTAVEFSTLNPKIAYAGSNQAIYRSEDGGHTWERRTAKAKGGGGRWGPPGIRAGFPIDLQVDPRNADRLFANNYSGGNFLSEDGGCTWTVASQGYTGAQVHTVVVDGNDPAVVYASARSGIFRSADGGATWQGQNHPPATWAEWYSVAADPRDGRRVLISDEHFGQLLRSMDGGSSWDVVFQCPGVDGTREDGRHGFKAIAFAPSAPDTVYAGACRERNSVEEGRAGTGFGIFRSDDGGMSWQEANDSRTASLNINVLAVDPLNAQVAYAGTVGQGVVATGDGGASWRPLNRGLRVLDIRALAIDPRNPKVVYAGAERGGVYRSEDAGSNWVPSSAGMDPQASVRALVIDSANSRVVYAADYRTGTYRSVDGGRSWSKVNQGLSTRAVTTLSLSADGRVLYAGTNGEGVFRLDLAAPGGG